MAFKFLQKFYAMFSNDIGIDLGTANTLVYVEGKGIVVREPSVVALNQKTGQVVAVGSQAKDMLGKTPGHIIAIRPIVDGVISDFEVTEEMMSYLINRAEGDNKKMLGPRVVVGVPSGITNVERRAVRDATVNAGAREVHIVEEPMAAAIGIGVPINDPVGNMIVDIGGGTTDIAIISLGGIVHSRNIKIAGDKLNNDITQFLKNELKILIGEKTAEDIKINIGSVLDTDSGGEMAVRGRDLITGLPREVVITESDVRDAIAGSINTLIESIKEVIEITPPEVVSDIMHRGLHLAGGGALIRGMKELLESVLKIPVHVAEDPLTAVVRGTGIILNDIDAYQDALIKNEDELPFTRN
ncbi:MAG: rod shape-determining protein MreB, rod shape-determining protein MreB-related protein [Candidatus Taylorbacteria bacterium]|nr:rod shape-determining protein MreB, rod shape-determining protein MreB-related protein [Candidatus Taylorbacteria bacterium]